MCIIGQATQIFGFSNKNLILIGNNFLYGNFKTIYKCFNSSYILQLFFIYMQSNIFYIFLKIWSSPNFLGFLIWYNFYKSHPLNRFNADDPSCV